ncbi:MAG TPA: hypothetical protein VFN31_03730 [Candidatus Saccharimonadales bacterium]|nr:hypothetical protein [Candidatus Saccharimonadales bacterium]
MSFIYALFFGAGATALAYNTLGKRVGYTNGKSMFITLASIFVLTTIVFFTLLAFVIHV